MSTLELFGDWIYFNGERLARLSPRVHPGRRMLLEEHLSAQHGTVDMSDQWSARVLIQEGRVLYEVVRDENNEQPFLPPGTEVIEVVSTSELQDVLDKIDMKLEL